MTVSIAETSKTPFDYGLDQLDRLLGEPFSMKAPVLGILFAIIYAYAALGLGLAALVPPLFALILARFVASSAVIEKLRLLSEYRFWMIFVLGASISFFCCVRPS